MRTGSRTRHTNGFRSTGQRLPGSQRRLREELLLFWQSISTRWHRGHPALICVWKSHSRAGGRYGDLGTSLLGFVLFDLVYFFLHSGV